MLASETIFSGCSGETLLVPLVSDTGISQDSATQAGGATAGEGGPAVSGQTASMDIRSFTRAIVKGDEAAFGEFYERFSGRLYGLLLFLTSGQEQIAREKKISPDTLRRMLAKVEEYSESHRAHGLPDDLLNILKDDLEAHKAGSKD